MIAARAALLTLALAGLLAAPAGATIPGVNGEIAVRHPDGRLQAVDPATGAVRSLTPPLATVDGRDVGPLTAVARGDDGPSWTPDGQTVLFDSDRATPIVRSRLHAVRADGTGMRELATGIHAGRDYDVHAAVDGRLHFTRFTYADGPRPYVAHEDGSVARPLAGAPSGFVGDVSPDGRQTAVHPSTGGLVVVGPAGVRVLLPGPVSTLGASWSPDGRTIVLERADEVLLVAADGAGPVRTFPVAGARDPVWSPDGEWLAFVRAGAGAAPALHVARADGTGLRRITPPGPALASPAWQSLTPG